MQHAHMQAFPLTWMGLRVSNSTSEVPRFFVASKTSAKALEVEACGGGQSSSPPDVLNPTPQHASSENGSCAAIFGQLCCRSCTATFAFLQAEVIFTNICAAASEKRQCNIDKAALRESGAFLPLSLRISSFHV